MQTPRKWRFWSVSFTSICCFPVSRMHLTCGTCLVDILEWVTLTQALLKLYNNSSLASVSLTVSQSSVTPCWGHFHPSASEMQPPGHMHPSLDPLGATLIAPLSREKHSVLGCNSCPFLHPPHSPILLDAPHLGDSYRLNWEADNPVLHKAYPCAPSPPPPRPRSQTKAV